MKIIVSIKQVPVRDSQLRIDANGRWIQENDLSFEINEPDAYALEEALQLKEKHGGEVVALCAGPARASQTIREALAKGADRAIHIEEENLGSFDTLGIAKLLSKAAEAEKPDLVLTGLQSDDLGYGQTGVVMAEIMGLPHGTIIMAAEKTDSGIRVKRELGRRLVPECRDAAAGGVDHSIRHQQAALRDADGHQEGQDQRGEEADGCRAWGCVDSHGRHRESISAAAHQADANAGRQCPRSRGEIS